MLLEKAWPNVRFLTYSPVFYSNHWKIGFISLIQLKVIFLFSLTRFPSFLPVIYF